MQTVALREIRSHSRRPATYWTRCLHAGAAAAIILIMMMQIGFGFLSGRSLFMTAVTVAFILCLLEGVRLAATAIVDERVDGTLGLLLLTKIRGGELLLGKFAALAFFSLQILLALTPVLAMSLLLGGVSSGEVARAAVALALTIILAISVGLVISANSRLPSRAIIATFVFLVAGSIILSLKGWPATGRFGFFFQSFNPLTPIWKIPDLAYTQFRTEYWLSILSTFVFCATGLWLASRDLFARFAKIEGDPAQRPQLGPEGQTARSFTAITEEQTLTRARWFKGNPIEWLTIRHLGLRGRLYLPLFICLCTGVVIVFLGGWGIAIGLIAFLIFSFMYAFGATATLARARQHGELELWLTTPLGHQAILTGIIAVMRKAFVFPGLILLLAAFSGYYVRMIVPFTQMMITGPSAATPFWPILYAVFSGALSMVAYLFAFPYVAMWIALKTKNPAQAAVRAFLWISITPWLLFCVPKWLIFIALALVAAHTVRSTLKNFATQRPPT